MKISGNTVLITGGGTGIGLALAKSFLNAGNEVIICGRRKEMLEAAKGKMPEIRMFQCDVAKPTDRVALFNHCAANFPNMNILVNNANILKMVNFIAGAESLFDNENEIIINLEAPIHLCALFSNMLIKQEESAIINVTSGLGFVPLAFMPVYCATKAGLHSFTISLRHQLRKTNVKVFEMIPPIVDTDLDKGARSERGQSDRGIKPAEVAGETMIALKNYVFEFIIGMSKNIIQNSIDNFELMFQRMNGNH